MGWMLICARIRLPIPRSRAGIELSEEGGLISCDFVGRVTEVALGEDDPTAVLHRGDMAFGIASEVTSPRLIGRHTIALRRLTDAAEHHGLTSLDSLSELSLSASL